MNSSHRSRFPCAPPMASALHSWGGAACFSSKVIQFQIERSCKELIPPTPSPHCPFSYRDITHASTPGPPSTCLHNSALPLGVLSVAPMHHGRCMPMCHSTFYSSFLMTQPAPSTPDFPCPTSVHLHFLCLQPLCHSYYILHNALRYSVLSLELKIQIHFMLI